MAEHKHLRDPDAPDAQPADRARRKLHARLAFAFLAALTLASFFLPGLLGIGSEEDIAELLGDLRGTLWAPIGVVAVFIVLGLVGAPQFAMILGAAILLGPWFGFAASWIGTMVSATIGFYLGKKFGARLVRRYGGRRVNSLSQALGHHGILATAMLRNLPAGPFIFVNMVAGLSHMGLGKFLIGTGVGSLPKMLALSFFGASFFALLLEGEPVHLLIAAAVLVAWLAFGWIVRRWWLRRSAALREVAAAAAVREEPLAGEEGPEQQKTAPAAANPPPPAPRPSPETAADDAERADVR